MTEVSVYNWENNRTSPFLCYVPKIVVFLGYVPFDSQAGTLGKRIVIKRNLLGMTQKELANRLGVDLSTLDFCAFQI